MDFRIGLDDASLAKLGYTYKLGRAQKVVLLMSVLLGFVPMWFLLRTRSFAEGPRVTLAAFLLHVGALALCAWYFGWWT